MHNIELSFACQDSSLSVRSFTIQEHLSKLFEIGLVVRSPVEDLDLDAFVGHGAAVRVTLDGFGTRAYTGVVSHMELVETEPAGLSRYHLRIVPELWRATQRTNARIFQHLSTIEIAEKLLAEYHLRPELELDARAFPRHEYRVQYLESDFAFLSRLFEDAGLTFYFRDPDPDADPKVSPGKDRTRLVIAADPSRGELRARGLLPWLPAEAGKNASDSIWLVQMRRAARPGKLTIRDFDFRSRPDVELATAAHASHELEDRLEVFEYRHGAFLHEPAERVADTAEDHVARTDLKEASALTARHLAAQRHGHRVITFHTNTIDLAPGSVFAIAGHPRQDLGPDRHLLVLGLSLRGAQQGDWTFVGEAAFAADPHRPARVTAKPRIDGVQSALVVGPEGAAIHTDEHGRVRLQFHWDRGGQRDHESSCFVRVSQAWAGAGHGFVAIPRVGDEVLVSFFDGDPDQPVIVGRVYNSSARPPYKLPLHKTRSAWVGESTPGGGGKNEIVLEDAKGGELVYVHAERDFERIVKHDETTRIGAKLSTTIGASEARHVKDDQSIKIGGSQHVEVGGRSSMKVSESFALELDGGTGAMVHKDQRIVFTTGQASLVLDGPNIYLDGAAMVRISAGDLAQISGGEVHVDGRPNVYLNSSEAEMPLVITAAMFLDAEAFDAAEAHAEAQFSEVLSTDPEIPGGADAVAPPAFVDAQLADARKKAVQSGKPAKQSLQTKLKKLKKIGENLIPKVEKARAEINARIDKLRGDVEKLKASINARIQSIEAHAKDVKARALAAVQHIKDDVQNAKTRVLNDIKAVEQRVKDAKQRAVDIVKNLKQRIADIKANSKNKFDELRKIAIEVMHAAQDEIENVKSTIDAVKADFKDIVDTVKDTIEDIKVTVKSTVDAIKGDIDTIKNEAMGIATDVKGFVNDVKTDGKALVDEVKNQAKELGKDAKEAWNDAKSAIGFSKHIDPKGHGGGMGMPSLHDKPELALGAKHGPDFMQQAQGGSAHGLSAVHGAHEGGGAMHALGAPHEKLAAQHLGAPVAELGGVAHGHGLQAASGHALGAPASNALAHTNGANGLNGLNGHGAPKSPIDQTTLITRPGGFGPHDLASAVNESHGPTILQSPSEGQLMILRTKDAMPLAADELKAHLVEQQMQGVGADEAYSNALIQRGYVVFERPWEAESGEFVKKAVL